MKQKIFLLGLTLVSLLLLGCQEKETKRSRSSSNPYNLNCTGQAYWTAPGCTGYCLHNPSAQGCNGSGNGTTTGAPTAGGAGAGTGSCSTSPFSYACYCQTYPQATGCSGTGVGALPSPGWGDKYHTSPPDNSASTCTTYYPSGVTQAFETRKGTITVGGGQWYNPASPSNLVAATNSSTLRSISAVKTFFITDSMLKIRFKTKPEPETQNSGDSICSGRTSQTWLPGYHKLKFTLSLVGTRADNSTAEEPLGIHTASVNSCTTGIDLSSYNSMYPNGMYLKISNVLENKGCSDWNWQGGFSNCNNWVPVRSSECWTMDIEVAADGTKTFD